MQQKSGRPMRTAQLYTQDNNATFSQILIQRFDTLKSMSSKKTISTKSVINNPLLKNAKHAAVLNDCGIDLDHPVLPVEVAARRAERVAREKKAMTPEQQLAVAQRLQRLGAIGAGQVPASVQAIASQAAVATPAVQVVTTTVAQPGMAQTPQTAVTTITMSVAASPSTPTSE